MARTSVVGSTHITTVQFSSTFFVGDNMFIDPRSKAIAVLRAASNYSEETEYDFDDYPMFERPIPKPPLETDVTMTIHNESPFIKVNRIKVYSVTVASVVQIGSTAVIDAEARAKRARTIIEGVEDIPIVPSEPTAIATALSLAPIVAEMAFKME